MNAQAMTERFELRLGPSVLEALDSWRARQDDLPSRSEAMRRLVEAGLSKSERRQLSLSEGERLITIMLCDLFKHLKVESEIEPDFVEEVIYGGHYWGLDWKYSGLFHSHTDSEAVVSEVVDILDMWRFLERGFNELSKEDMEQVAADAKPFGEHVVFSGFDGNGEGQYIGVARFMIDQLDHFTGFKGRDLNAHMPMLGIHRRMLSVFEPIRATLIGRELSAAEITRILQEGPHPSRRNA